MAVLASLKRIYYYGKVKNTDNFRKNEVVPILPANNRPLSPSSYIYCYKTQKFAHEEKYLIEERVTLEIQL